MSEEFDREAFIQEIKLAFAEVPKPPNDQICFARGDLTDVDFEGNHWAEIAKKLATDYQLSLGNLTPEGFHFFYPHLLIARFLDPEAVELEAFLTYVLLPINEGEQREKEILELVKHFNTDQRNIIKKHVELFLKDNPFEDAREGKRSREFWAIV